MSARRKAKEVARGGKICTGMVFVEDFPFRGKCFPGRAKARKTIILAPEVSGDRRPRFPRRQPQEKIFA